MMLVIMIGIVGNFLTYGFQEFSLIDQILNHSEHKFI